jgi:hypothetical protein
LTIGVRPGYTPAMRSVVLFTLCACASDPTSNLTAELSWTFNYRDWTKPRCEDTGVTCPASPSAPCKCDDIRGCDNQGTNNPGPDYHPVATVEVVLDDHTGPLYHESFDCSRGSAQIKGLVPQIYELRMSATNAAGVVMYKETVPELDLTSLHVEQIELRAAVGELRMTPRYPNGDPYTCPADVESLAWSMRNPTDDSEVVGGVVAACDALDTSNELFLRNIPSFPEEDDTGAFTPVTYNVVLEATDAAGSGLYCFEQERPVFPGRTNLGGDPNLVSGACP